jgi:hypothetical protein
MMLKSRLESWLRWCVTLLVVVGLFAALPAQTLAAKGAGGEGGDPATTTVSPA